jgi:hypothetical protein
VAQLEQGQGLQQWRWRQAWQGAQGTWLGLQVESHSVLYVLMLDLVQEDTVYTYGSW